MKPKAKSVDGLLHLRYGLAQNIHVSKVYPLSAPNGSSILVCGHDQGLLIVWRGGRPLKANPNGNKGRNKKNGSATQDSMEIDSGDEESGEDQGNFIDKSIFEDEEEEFDPSNPYQPIIQHLDLLLSTEVLHVSFPQLSHLSSNTKVPLAPKLLQENLVIAVACADCTVRLLTVPLTPPSPQSKGRRELKDNVTLSYAGQGTWGEQMITMPATLGHQSLPKGVSVAFAPRAATTIYEEALDDDDKEEYKASAENKWDAILASHSSDLNGMLLIHKIPVTDDGLSLMYDSTDTDLLWRRQPLAHPAVSIQLHVATHAGQPRYPRVLIAEQNGAVRIFNCCSSSSTDHGFWAISLYPAFQTSTEGVTQYKRLLDAAWIFSGKAVVVLAVDGEWGIWNLSYEKASSSGTSRKTTIITGGIPTRFALSGWIGGAPISSGTTKSGSAKEQKFSTLAPMTPGTRKIRQEALFSASAPQSIVSASGGIGVYQTGRAYGGKEDDETVVLWHGDRICMIPNLQSYWQNKMKGSGNLFGAGASGQLRDGPSVDLGAESRTAVSIFPVEEGLSGSGKVPRQPEFLVSGERSFVVVAPALTEPESSSAKRPGAGSAVVDPQLLLTRGELDVNSIDRILDGMANGEEGDGGMTNGLSNKRKVLFASSS